MSVFVIAGPSNVGKSTVASALAERLRARVLEVDDLARRSRHPALAWERDPTVWRRSPEELLELLIAKAEALAPVVSRWIDIVSRWDANTIIEGEGPSPANLQSNPAGIRRLFIVEPDPARFRATVERRSRSFRALMPDEQDNVVAMNILYGEWLRERCAEAGSRCVRSQPWATLADRCGAALADAP